METTKLFPNDGWLSTAETARLLGISRRQLDRDREVLLNLEVQGFEYYGKGFNRSSFEVLKLFRSLVESRGRGEAIAKITQFVEEYHAS